MMIAWTSGRAVQALAPGFLLALAAASCAAVAPIPRTAVDSGSASPVPTEVSPCTIFPVDNIWNTPIVDAPIHPLSDRYVQSIGPDEPVRPDFGAGLWEGSRIGIPYAEIPVGTRGVEVGFDYADESDPGLYPLPENPPIEGGPASEGDRHILLLSRADCRLYELYAAYPEAGGGWRAGSGAIFDLRSNDLRPAGWTSADAAGLPIFPGLVRYGETVSGEIRHALRFTAPRTQRAYVWPARHFASDLTDTAYPPMGQRFRLRADFDIHGFSREVQTILRALQVYGMILADNGSPWFLSGTPDERWNNDELHELGRITGRDFEAVDVSEWMVEVDSARVAH